MKDTIRYVGLDVHKDSIVIAVAEEGGGEPEILATIPNELNILLKHLRRLGPSKSLRCCYEAGPTGYGLCRELKRREISCVVVAPSLVPVQAGNRVKTDRRDARKLARFLRSGDLTAVHVPEEATEAMRDLERAREDFVDHPLGPEEGAGYRRRPRLRGAGGPSATRAGASAHS